MKYFTKSQVEELRKQLATLGVRDTDLPDAATLTGEEEIAIVQDGVNRKVKVADLFAGNVPIEIIESLKPGKSAYEIAVEHGFEGTEQEWLDSLVVAAQLNAATGSDLGGIKLGYSQNEKNYPVLLDSANRAYVSVPWKGTEGGGDVVGGYYELIFTITTTETAPTLPENYKALDTSSGWYHYAPNNVTGTGIIWLAVRFVSGEGVYTAWDGPSRISGPGGEAGIDGDKYEYVYARTDSESTSPANPNSGIPSSESIARGITTSDLPDFVPQGWYDHPNGVTSELPVEWMAFRVRSGSKNGVGGVWTSFVGPVLWSSYGRNGTDGDGVEYVFFAGTSLPQTELPASWTNDSDFQNREYIRESQRGVWFDDPVDLDAEQYGPGTKQWVCTRKKYADITDGPVTWHAYSEPALWSNYAQDGDAGIGIVADLDNEMMAIPLQADGSCYSFSDSTRVRIYNGTSEVAAVISSVSVKDSTGTTYDSQSWVTYQGSTVFVAFTENAINLDSKQLSVTITASANVTVDNVPQTVTRNVVLTIIGVKFGTDGSSYRLSLDANLIRKKDDGTLYPTSILPQCIAVNGSERFRSYTGNTISNLGNFSIKVKKDNGSFTTVSFPVSVSTSGVTESMVFRLYFGSTVIDQETVPVVLDGVAGGHNELIFATNNSTTEYPALPLNGEALPDSSVWKHYAPNSGIVWMTTRYVSGSTYGNWETPWVISGTDGNAGVDGTKFEYIYARTANDTVVPTGKDGTVPASGSTGQTPADADFVPQGWTDSPSGIDATTYRAEWMCVRSRSGSRNGEGGTWTEFQGPVLWSTWGRNGTDGDGTEYIYYAGTTSPAIDPYTWDPSTTEFQNTREYRPAGSGWNDNPIDIESAPVGTKQYVAIRKKYVDSGSTEPVWHRYSHPAFWNNKAKDGDAGTGVVADLTNDMMAAAIKSDGRNYDFDQSTQVEIYNGAATASDTAITSIVSVEDSLGTSYTPSTWVSYSGKTVRVQIPENAIDLSSKHLLITVRASATVVVAGESSTAVRDVVLQVIGVHFGEDGTTYQIVPSTNLIHKDKNSLLSPPNITVTALRTRGLEHVSSYSVTELLESDPRFSFAYAVDDNPASSLTTDTLQVASLNVLNYVRIELRFNGTLVDQETIMVVEDGTDGSNAFRLDLNNENDSILYDAEGNKLSANVEATATLYNGGTPVTSGVTYSINGGYNTSECQASINGSVVTVTAITAAHANILVTAQYAGLNFTQKLSVTRIVGSVKYDLLVSPDSVSYNRTTGDVNALQINVKAYRTAQSSSGSVERQLLTSLPSQITLYVNGLAVTGYGSNGYSIPVNFTLDSYTISLRKNNTEILDEETVPISKVEDGGKYYTVFSPQQVFTVPCSYDGEILANNAAISNQLVLKYGGEPTTVSKWSLYDTYVSAPFGNHYPIYYDGAETISIGGVTCYYRWYLPEEDTFFYTVNREPARSDTLYTQNNVQYTLDAGCVRLISGISLSQNGLLSGRVAAMYRDTVSVTVTADGDGNHSSAMASIVLVFQKVKNGEPGSGSAGPRGKIMRGVTEFTLTPEVPYEGLDDETGLFYDVVTYNDQLYYCKVASYNGTAASQITPGTNSNVWVQADNFKFVATEVLLAQNAKVGPYALNDQGLSYDASTAGVLWSTQYGLFGFHIQLGTPERYQLIQAWPNHPTNGYLFQIDDVSYSGGTSKALRVNGNSEFTGDITKNGNPVSCIVRLTNSEFNTLVSGDTVDPDTIYVITDTSPKKVYLGEIQLV